MTPKPGIPLNEPQTEAVVANLRKVFPKAVAAIEREAQGIPLIDVELLARAYEMGWTHGRDGESPNPRAAIEGVARLASESSIPVEEGEPRIPPGWRIRLPPP